MIRIGDRGRTISSLHPQGFVRIDGKRYDARSAYDPLESDTEVVVIGGDLQGLKVRKVESKLVIEELPGYGKSVQSSFREVLLEQERLAAAHGEQWRAQRRRWRAARRLYGLALGTPLGALFAVAGLWIAWDHVNQVSEAPWETAAWVVGIGICWSVGFFWLLDRAQQYFMEGLLPKMNPRVYDHLTLLSTALGLSGATTAAVLVIPSVGLSAGLTVAMLATCVLGLIVPGFLFVNAPAYEE